MGIGSVEGSGHLSRISPRGQRGHVSVAGKWAPDATLPLLALTAHADDRTTSVRSKKDPTAQAERFNTSVRLPGMDARDAIGQLKSTASGAMPMNDGSAMLPIGAVRTCERVPRGRPVNRVGRARSSPLRARRALSSLLAMLLATSTTAFGQPMKQPDIKLNPAPQKRYDITLTIDGAPGPFDTITGMVDYKVTNDRCVPITPIIGATLAPEKRIPVVLNRVSDHVYKGSFYADRLLDEDYYGMGVCHWGVTGASADLKVGKVDFNPSIFMSEIVARKPVTRYFAKRSYLHADIARVDIGNASRADFQQDAHDTFAITLQAEEAP